MTGSAFKTVCVIGAGPAGLTTAKTLLAARRYRVTVFDAQRRVGGLWPASRSESNGFIDPLMVANQSRHTLQFSDLAWEDAAPQMPRAWQVGRYLQRYSDTYCREVDIRLGCKIERVEWTQRQSWVVWARGGDGEVDEMNFDFLVVASGFFGRPVVPEAVRGYSGAVPVMHSSQYRNLRALLGPGGAGGKILVVGGQMSGVEMAATLAMHLSAAVNALGASPIACPEKYSLHHLLQRPIWIFPRFTSPEVASATPFFAPVDLCSYNLANRPQPLTNTHGHLAEEAARAVHSIYESVLGNDQSCFSPFLQVSESDRSRPPFLAISDHYMEFLRSGFISVSNAKLESLSNVATVVCSGKRQEIDDIAAVVLATGFEAASSISFLPPAVQETLSVVPSDLNNTVALAFHGTHHPSVPSLGLVGFYRSPYWGVMEMQARFLAALWASDPRAIQAVHDDDSIHRTLALRTDPCASQFSMGDYAWLMDRFAAALGLAKQPHTRAMPRLSPADKKMNILTPARYPPSDATPGQRKESLDSIKQTEDTVWEAVADAKYVARGVFRSLLGTWRLQRHLESRLPTHPSGLFSGTAEFRLRESTDDGGEQALGMTEYLYVEAGDFCAANSAVFRATRRYVWRFDERAEKMSVWFVKTNDQKEADFLFHEIKFVRPGPDGVEAKKGWEARAGHLCDSDYYDVRYNFRFEGVSLREWCIGYTVKGPKKDYTIEGVYRR